MPVAQTSMEAFYKVRNLTAKQWEVYRVIKELQPVSDSQIAQALTLRLGKQISAAQVSPRRGELYRDNLIRKSGERLNDNNRHEDTWSVTE